MYWCDTDAIPVRIQKVTSDNTLTLCNLDMTGNATNANDWLE